MTCGVAVKRPLDYESYLNSESGIDIKRARKTNPQCSPFRPQFGTLASSLTNTGHKMEPGSLFEQIKNKCQLSDNQLDSYLRAEVQYLKRRKLIPRRNIEANCSVKNEGTDLERMNVKDYRGASSPTSNNSDSDGEMNHSPKTQAQQQSIALPVADGFMNSIYEKPQFSLRQVKLICERLLSEQEIRLRYEYEALIVNKLEEKHEQFVQFAKEQLDGRSQFRDESSYFS